MEPETEPELVDTLPDEELALTTVAPAGSASVHDMVVAEFGPALLTTMVAVMLLP